TDLPDRAGKTRACLTAGPNQPEHKKTDTPGALCTSLPHALFQPLASRRLRPETILNITLTVARARSFHLPQKKTASSAGAVFFHAGRIA
ncbi:hypothetical protein, partial [Pseudomonas syringae]|uniref:hypothetical protein n=1 Tax=Pseudomonas syringae TaxID=317 RepID=UPI001FF79D9C